MTMTLELPFAADETPRPHLHMAEDSQDALEAAAALETVIDPDEATEQEELIVRLTKPIDDAINNFHAEAGTVFTVCIDGEGDVYIPILRGSGHEDGSVYLEPEEYEVVELSDETEPAAGGGAESSSDQPAGGNTPAEPATPPAVELCSDAHAPRVVHPSPRERYLRDKSAMEERLAGLTIEEMKLKETAKLCKKEREVLAEQLSNLIDGWERGPAPDAATPEPATAGVAAETASEGQPIVDVSTEPDDRPPAMSAAITADAPESSHDEQARYRHVLEAAAVSELALQPKLEKKLTAADVTTIWQLETLRGEISQGKAKWPKGIGAAKVTMIEDAILKWMSRNQATWDAGEADRDAEVAQTSVDHAQPENEPTVAEAPDTEHNPLDDL